MTKPAQPQGAFSFLDEVEKVEPIPKPKKNILRPPATIELEVTEEETVLPAQEEAVVTGGEDELPEDAVITAEDPDHDEEPEAADESEKSADLPERRPPGTRGRRSVRENSIAADAVEMPDEEELFKKHYYSMGEVTAMFKESHSLIRYWESEFDILKPKKNGKGDRFFRPQDVKNLFLIYDLLRRRKFTIEGAKEYLKNHKKADEKFAAVQSLQRIRGFLLELKAGI
ncbi:MerR family transcriptional regulator [Niabella sp. CC-SYL272]|uniref:MerR family transcriptional regulator n=1 Tax=Niabella agricola TaxID=2891571 RepID=UPI001F351E1B|nr:MerR family transcriptional regulator [Niabella agricola]MCF3111002.1 MerR family transcriptional regulator [Niabella agricola]